MEFTDQWLIKHGTFENPVYAADCLLKLCFEMPKLTVERITTLPATPNGVQCNCALCDGHIMKMSRSATVAIPPRKYARIDPAGKRHNTLGEYTIIMACGTYGTNIRAPFDNSYTVLEDVKCDVPVGLPSTIADRYSGKRSGLRNMCKMRSINACRMPSLSDPTLDARSCALPDILRSCLTVDGRPIKIGDKVLFTRQPTESYESIVVLTVVRFIDCPCLCINTNVLDTVLRGDDDGDDLNAFPLTRLASKDEDLVAIPARVNVANRDAVFMTVNDFRSIYAAPDSGYLGSGILRLIEFGILSHTQVDAFRSSKYNKCEQITVGSSNRCVFQSMQPHRQDHVGSLENIVHVATSDSLKGVVGENTRHVVPPQSPCLCTLWSHDQLMRLQSLLNTLECSPKRCPLAVCVPTCWQRSSGIHCMVDKLAAYETLAICRTRT